MTKWTIKWCTKLQIMAYVGMIVKINEYLFVRAGGKMVVTEHDNENRSKNYKRCLWL